MSTAKNLNKGLGRRAAPRYRLDTSNQSGVRFVSERSRQIHRTVMIDVSETGVSIVASRRTCPQIGEIIKMDFSLDGSAQIACLGRTVRIEYPTKNSSWARFPSSIKVGIAFHNLPPSYQRLLSQTLKRLLAAEAALDRKQTSLAMPEFSISKRAVGIFFGFLMAGITVFLLYVALSYLEQKHPKEEAPWATNFFNRVQTPSKSDK